MSTVFLPNRRKSLYHRIQIPRRLRPYFDGRAEIWRSLKTTDKDEARTRIAHWQSRAQRVFAVFRKHGNDMTQDEREALVERWLNEALEQAEDWRADSGPASERDNEDYWFGLSHMFDDAQEDLIGRNYTPVGQEVDELVKRAGLPAMNHSGTDFGRLARLLLLAKMEYTRIESDRLDGIYVKKNGHLQPALAAHPSPKPIKPTGPLFSKVAQQYLKEVPRSVGSATQMKVEHQTFLKAIGGDKPIDAITKADCRTYKQDILDKRKLSQATCMKKIFTLSGLFTWASKQGYIPDNANPARGLAPDKKAARKEAMRRRPFTSEELLKVFGSQEFIAQRQTRPERYWLCLACLFTGARREEIGQLQIVDIQEEDGIPYFNITPEGDGEKTVKTEGSERRVPVHSSLVKLGFLEYVESIKTAGHSQVFPQLKKQHGKCSGPVGKFFARLMDKVGLSDPRLVLHSTRHNLVNGLRAAQCPRETIDLLDGHRDGSVHEGYAHLDKLPMRLLRDGLERLGMMN